MAQKTFRQIQNMLCESRSAPATLPKLDNMQGAFKDIQIKTLCKEKIILVAGTNGKGTTAKTLQTLLTESGQSVGLFTSPHLISICESIEINGEHISEELFVKCFHQVFDLSQKWRLSAFEILTLMAIYIFFTDRLLPPLEYAIFEVGMGGLWDATNVIPHKISIITQIAYDHQHVLGHTLEDIAKHKLGIIHNHNHVIGSSVFNKNSQLHLLKEKVIQKTQSLWHDPDTYTYQTKILYQQPKGFIYIYGQEQEISLLGQRAAENISMALKCYEVLGFHPSRALHILKKINWKGRMHKEDLTFCPCPVYFSGDHNQQGIKSLIVILNDLNYQNIYFLVSVSQTRAIGDILPDLLNVKNSKIYLTTTKFKGQTKEDYKKWISQVTEYIKKPIEALKQIRYQCHKDDLVVVTGSLYLVGELMEYIYNKP